MTRGKGVVIETFKRLILLTLALVLLASTASAMPQDTPVEYPALEMAAEEEFVLEMADDEEEEPIIVKPDIGTSGQTQVITVSLAMDIDFDYPYSSGVGNFSNPETSMVNVQYVLQISSAELQRKLGRTGYTPEEYAEMSAQPDFDPQKSWITIGQTKGIAPGKTVKTIALAHLPDGTALPKGEYEAYAVMSAFDVKTNKRSVVGVRSQVTIRILNDTFTVVFADGVASISLANPVDAQGAVKYSLVLTQAELLEKTAATHCQGEYNPAAIVTVCDVGELLPGEVFENAPITLMPLPDGENLPAGEYIAWVAQSDYDVLTAQWILSGFGTQVLMTVE